MYQEGFLPREIIIKVKLIKISGMRNLKKFEVFLDYIVRVLQNVLIPVFSLKKYKNTILKVPMTINNLALNLKDTCLKTRVFSPTGEAQLGVALHKAKGHWFDAWSGHMPGLSVQSLVGALLRGNGSMFLPPSFSLSFPSL